MTRTQRCPVCGALGFGLSALLHGGLLALLLLFAPLTAPQPGGGTETVAVTLGMFGTDDAGSETGPHTDSVSDSDTSDIADTAQDEDTPARSSPVAGESDTVALDAVDPSVSQDDAPAPSATDGDADAADKAPASNGADNQASAAPPAPDVAAPDPAAPPAPDGGQSPQPQATPATLAEAERNQAPSEVAEPRTEPTPAASTRPASKAAVQAEAEHKPKPATPPAPAPKTAAKPQAEHKPKPATPPAPAPKSAPEPKPAAKPKPVAKPTAKPKPADQPRASTRTAKTAAAQRPSAAAGDPRGTAARAAAAGAPNKAERGTGGGAGTGAGIGDGPVSSAAQRSAEYRYLKELQRAISRRRYYPNAARRSGLEGTAKVQFTIASDGGFSGIGVSVSSGSRELDDAALTTIRRLGRFKPIPLKVGRNRWTVRVPIVYRLN